MALVGEVKPSQSKSADDGEWRLGDHWASVVEVLEAELGHDPQLLDRVLLALANAGTTRLAAVGS